MSVLYRCRVIDASGRINDLERRSSSPALLARELRAQGLDLVECKEAAAARIRPLSANKVLEFTQALSLLLGQNLTLPDAMRVLGGFVAKGDVSHTVAEIQRRLEKGESLATALSHFGNSFHPLYVGLVRVGEMTGTLNRVMPQLCRYLADRKAFRDKLLGSLMYPALILVVLIVGMTLLTAFVLPTFLQVAESLQGAGTGDLRSQLLRFQVSFACVFFAVPIAILMAKAWRREPSRKKAWDRAMLTRFPFDRVFRVIELRSLCFALETLTSSGYTVDVALDECRSITSNTALVAALEEVRDKAKKGIRLSRAFRETGIMPESLCGWIAVGEEAQDLERVFGHLRAHYEYEFEKLSRALMGLMEPTIIMLIGAVLAIVILQFIGPIFSLLGGMA